MVLYYQQTLYEVLEQTGVFESIGHDLPIDEAK